MSKFPADRTTLHHRCCAQNDVMRKPRKDPDDYREYELLVKSLVSQQLSELPAQLGVKVSHDLLLQGMSGFSHQIDVAFEYTLLGSKILGIIECKNYKRAVSVEDLLAFKSRVDDLRANHALFVTTVGFQSGAVDFAHANRISLVKVEGCQWDTYQPPDAAGYTPGEREVGILKDAHEFYQHSSKHLTLSLTTETLPFIPKRWSNLRQTYSFRWGDDVVTCEAGHLFLGKFDLEPWRPGLHTSLVLDDRFVVPSSHLVRFLIILQLLTPHR